jgi:hypothetical protein
MAEIDYFLTAKSPTYKYMNFKINNLIEACAFPSFYPLPPKGGLKTSSILISNPFRGVGVKNGE